MSSLLETVLSKEYSATRRLSFPNFGDNSQAQKKHKPKLLSPDIFWWGGGLPREGVGAKKFGMSLETKDIKLFLVGYPVILLGYPGGPRKV